MHFKIKLTILLFAVLNFSVQSQTQNSKPKSTFPDCVFYEIFVGSYFDTNNDSIGDLKGITAKLDYLHETGIEAIILSPIAWSFSNNKMDAIEFTIVDPQYGNVDDLKELIAEAHSREIKILLSINVNYTSIQHPWFDEAKSSVSNSFRNCYVWKNSKDISADKSHWFELNSKGNKNEEKYFSFYGAQFPCLNFNDVALQNRLMNVYKYWINEVGSDGFKFIDADKIYIEEKLLQPYWNGVIASLQKIKPESFYILHPYENILNAGKLLNKQKSGIVFPEVTTEIRAIVSKEKDNGFNNLYKELTDSISKSTSAFTPFTFLNTSKSNRFASEINNDQKNKLALAILLTLPGSPVLFYGDEIGLKGLLKNDHNLEGFIWQVEDDSRAAWLSNLYNDEFKTTPLNKQTNDVKSTYELVRKLIWIRKSNEVMNKGSLVKFDLNAPSVLSFFREYGRKQMLVLHNLSFKEIEVNLDLLRLSAFKIYFSNSVDIKPQSQLKLSPYSTTMIQLY